MEVLQIEQVDNVYVRVHCDRSIALELSEYFTFYTKNHIHHPKVKAKIWDGKIRLYSLKTRLVYAGLVQEIEKFAKARKYKVDYLTDFSRDEFSVNEAEKFVASLNLPFPLHDHQMEAFITAVRDKRNITLSPTSSGKSLIIYLLLRYYGKKSLLIVPTTSLVDQMANDFKGYGFNSDKYCHLITAGAEKRDNKPIIISTWQSIYDLPEEYFSEYDVIIGDEVHGFKATCLKSIMEKTKNAEYRFGLTGTLDDCETDKTTLKGLFGQVRSFVTTKELMEKGIVAKLNLDVIILKHKVTERVSGYQEEVDYMLQSESRNRFIKNLTLSLEGNIILLFQYTERGEHGRALYDMIKSSTNRPVHFINGEMKGKDREALRPVIESSTGNIMVASFKTFSTGISIKNIQHVILGFPRKTKIGLLQSIGRGLRVNDEKDSVNLFDIADNLVGAKTNTTLQHLIERLKIYEQEQFPYKIYKVALK